MTNIQLDALDRFKSWQWWGNFDLREGVLEPPRSLQRFVLQRSIEEQREGPMGPMISGTPI